MRKFLYILLGLFVLFLGITFLLPSAKLSKDYCAFCDPKVLESQKFYEDDTVIALYTHKPAMPGHCLVLPKRHVERFEALTEKEAASISRVIQKVDQAVTKVYHRSAYLLLQKNGVEAGQSVPHVHFHYLPKQAGDDSSLKFLLRLFLSNLQKPLPPSEMKTVCDNMKEAM